MSDTPRATIPELVEDAARRFDGAEALVDGEVRLSFAELAERAHRVSRALMASGIQPGDRVGIWAPNMAEWVVAALGIYGTGAVLVPVNTRFKGREAAYVLSKGNVRLLFALGDFLGTDYVRMLREADDVPSLEEIVLLAGPPASGTVAWPDFLARGDSVPDAQRQARAAAVDADDLCHILFTSGTTGHPKGVMLEHGQICRAYVVFAQVVDMREGDRYLIVTPMFHSFGLHCGIICSLMMGVTMVPHGVFDAPSVCEAVRKERITVFPGPPTIFQTILNDPNTVVEDVATLRVVAIAAASIPSELFYEVRDRLGVDSVLTGYGLTEASGIVSMCQTGDSLEIVSQTSGRALPGLEIRTVDGDGNDVPAGEAGELLVRGYNLMRGYLDDPEQTREAIDEDGWLHTGDVVVIRPDGNVVITDRIKDMFIVGGFNVYPAELEDIMSNHPDIAQVAVIGMPDERMGEVGCAFVIPRAGAKPSAEAIIQWCRDEMANFKVPRRVEIVDELPLNASGKVLKHELRARIGG